MVYNLIMTERAEELLDSLVNYLLYEFKSKQAASHLLDEIDEVIELIINNPYQFPKCSDNYLYYKNYREASLPQMRYVIVYYIEEEFVYIAGVYHELELYSKKL